MGQVHDLQLFKSYLQPKILCITLEEEQGLLGTSEPENVLGLETVGIHLIFFPDKASG